MSCKFAHMDSPLSNFGLDGFGGGGLAGTPPVDLIDQFTQLGAAGQLPLACGGYAYNGAIQHACHKCHRSGSHHRVGHAIEA